MGGRHSDSSGTKYSALKHTKEKRHGLEQRVVFLTATHDEVRYIPASRLIKVQRGVNRFQQNPSKHNLELIRFRPGCGRYAGSRQEFRCYVAEVEKASNLSSRALRRCQTRLFSTTAWRTDGGTTALLYDVTRMRVSTIMGFRG